MPPVAVPASFPFVPELGEPVRVFRVGLFERLACIVILGVLLIPAALFAFLAYKSGGMPGIPTESVIFIDGLTIVCLAAALYLGWRFVRSWTEAAVLYTNGFAYQTYRHTHAFKWSDIAGLTAKVIRYAYTGVVPMGTSYDCRVCDSEGREVRLNDSLPRIRELVEQIHSATLPGLIERSSAAFEAGQTVDLGALSLNSKAGLGYGGQTYPWGDIVGVTAENGKVIVSTRRKGSYRTFSIPAARVRNVDVFFALVLNHLASLAAATQQTKAGVAVETAPSGTATEQLRTMQQLELMQAGLVLENKFRRGVGWFYWIAGLSMINVLLILSGTGWSFLIGLASNELIAWIAFGAMQEAAGGARLVISGIAVLFCLCIAGLFALCGIFARRRQSWALIGGMVLYALDGVASVAFGDWIGAAFHGLALYGLCSGLAAMRQQMKLHARLGE